MKRPRRYKATYRSGVSPEEWRIFINSSHSGPCPSCFKDVTGDRKRHMTGVHKVKIRSLQGRKDRPENDKNPLVSCVLHYPTPCLRGNIRRCWDKATTKYKTRANNNLSEARERFHGIIETSKKRTRLYEHSQWKSQCLSTLELGEPISKRDYLMGYWKEGTKQFVICSPDQAKEILEAGPPLLSILVLRIPNKTDLQELDEYCLKFIRRIKAGLPLHVFNYNKAASNKNPQLMPAENIMQQYEDGKGPVFNILNIPMDPEEDDWMGKIQGFDLIPRICEEAKRRGIDLSSLLEAIRLMLVATRDAVSLEHFDKHGFITRIKLWSGYKFWTVACKRSKEAVEEVTESGEYCGERFTIFLEKGSELIQPSGTLHSVLTAKENAITSCFMYWHPMIIRLLLDQTLLEIRNPTITNDEHISFFIEAIDIAFYLESIDDPGTWPGKEEMDKARETFQMIKEEWPRSNTGT